MATIEELNGWQRSWPGTNCPVGVLGVAGVTLGVAKGQPADPLVVVAAPGIFVAQVEAHHRFQSDHGRRGWIRV
jgi:hypothetical protein